MFGKRGLVFMDKKLKALWYIIIMIFILACAYGAVKGNIVEKKGMLDVSKIEIMNDTYGLRNSYSVSCDVLNLVPLDYLKMKTTYYDKYMNILAENNISWYDENIMSNVHNWASDQIGYKPGADGVLPDSVQITFFNKPNGESVAESIYRTSFKILNVQQSGG
ncbi:MAG: hypothetical protein LBR15_10870 [Methanobrevibacter sp.]|jgi:hypothetical protein|nr:hypothetical protein [Candidatus Methanovirga australis]